MKKLVMCSKKQIAIRFHAVIIASMLLTGCSTGVEASSSEIDMPEVYSPKTSEDDDMYDLDTLMNYQSDTTWDTAEEFVFSWGGF